MPEIISKIKSIFNDEALDRIAQICDTHCIYSQREKMILVMKTLVYYDIPYMFLGGATNRMVFQLKGYAVKIALDDLGYHDNEMEFSLCNLLRDYTKDLRSEDGKPLYATPKVFETNGYMLIMQYLTLMSKTEFKSYRVRKEAVKILGRLANKYLMGDVGLILKNYTNWGLSDDSLPQIIDFAYIHPATEKLFVCDACGSIMKYDNDYVNLWCSECGAHYTYNDRTRKQGTGPDFKMINNAKHASLMLEKGVTSIIVENSSSDNDNFIVSAKAFVILNQSSYNDYLEIVRILNDDPKNNIINEKFDILSEIDENGDTIYFPKAIIKPNSDIFNQIYQTKSGRVVYNEVKQLSENDKLNLKNKYILYIQGKEELSKSEKEVIEYERQQNSKFWKELEALEKSEE